MEKVLVTGGAGFIGNTVVKNLAHEFEVVVLDDFSPQIHGKNYESSFLYKNIDGFCTIIKGNVCNGDDMARALEGVDYVIHLAADTGTGQSMYEINRYTENNIFGTSNLLETILKKKLAVKKILLSSSRSVYGEGMYSCNNHGIVVPFSRNIDDMRKGDFEVKCPICGENVELELTTEDCTLRPISYYAYTKLAQEKMLETMCPVMGIDYTIFRYQNVYGPGQSLNNPYTGILSIFSKLLLQNQLVNIFEDGLESRDFVHVEDVAAVTCNALKNPGTNNQYINVGSGRNVSVLEIANLLKKLYSSDSSVKITGDFRKGDIRHNVADISKVTAISGYKPRYSIEDGLRGFAAWVVEQNIDNKLKLEDNGFERSIEEMKAVGLFVQGE